MRPTQLITCHQRRWHAALIIGLRSPRSVDSIGPFPTEIDLSQELLSLGVKLSEYHYETLATPFSGWDNIVTWIEIKRGADRHW